MRGGNCNFQPFFTFFDDPPPPLFITTPTLWISRIQYSETYTLFEHTFTTCCPPSGLRIRINGINSHTTFLSHKPSARRLIAVSYNTYIESGSYMGWLSFPYEELLGVFVTTLGCNNTVVAWPQTGIFDPNFHTESTALNFFHHQAQINHHRRHSFLGGIPPQQLLAYQLNLQILSFTLGKIAIFFMRYG